MSNEVFDPAPYTNPPRMTLESGIALARALVAACPQSMPTRIHKAAQKLAGATDLAQAKLALRQKALGSISEDDKRAIDQAADGSWGALRSRLSAYSMLPTNEYPDAQRATELLTILFADSGLSFLIESYPVQWTTADTLLQRIQKDNLAADIDRIAGPDFLDNIRKRHARYGQMIQHSLVKSLELQVDLSDELRVLGHAIVAYATKICAHVDEDDKDSLAEARAALQPIDLFREAYGKSSSPQTNAPPPTPTTP